MKAPNIFRYSHRLAAPGLLPAIFVSASLLLVGQEPPTKQAVETQREAMHKLSFLVGHWSGPVTVNRGPGQELHFTQTEDVEYKLNGLVLVVEGKSTSDDGKTVFSALATIAYDDSTHAYRIRAYNDGHYIDTELTVSAEGFTWAFMAGPAHIVNSMHLTPAGQWDEVTSVSVGGNPPHPSLKMLLQRR